MSRNKQKEASLRRKKNNKRSQVRSLKRHKRWQIIGRHQRVNKSENILGNIHTQIQYEAIQLEQGVATSQALF